MRESNRGYKARTELLNSRQGATTTKGALERFRGETFPKGGAAVLEEVGQRSLCVFKGWLDKAVAHLLFVTVLQETGTGNLGVPFH